MGAGESTEAKFCNGCTRDEKALEAAGHIPADKLNDSDLRLVATLGSAENADAVSVTEAMEEWRMEADAEKDKETNALYTNETNGVYTNGIPHVRRRRLEKSPHAIIKKVKRQATKDISKGNQPKEAFDVKLASEVDSFVKLKLMDWDQDESGTFSHDEVIAAMDELRSVQKRHRKLKGNVITGFGVLLVFVGLMIATVFVVMKLTRSTKVGQDGVMKAPRQESDSNSPGKMAGKVVGGTAPVQLEVVETTEGRGVVDLGELLAADESTDQWLIADARLREIDQLSFTLKDSTYYNLAVAELTRIDSGKNAKLDQVNIVTTGGHQLRFWESVGQLEVRWVGSRMWEALEVAGERRLDEPEENEEDDDRSVMEQHPRKLSSKGSTVVFVGVGYHGRSGGGGRSSTCKGRCSVPQNDPNVYCRDHCKDGECYDHKKSDGTITTYQCDHSWTEDNGDGLAALIFFVLFCVGGHICCCGFCIWRAKKLQEENQQDHVLVQCPPGAYPGTTITAQTHKGTIQVAVPPGISPGQMIRVNL